MGRFSRLETGKQESAPARPQTVDLMESGPPTGADEADYEGRDAAGCIAQGDLLLFMEEQKQALRWYSRAVDLESSRIAGWTRLIGVLLLRRDLGEAGAWIGRALAVYPDTPSLIALRAVEHARRGLIRQAMAASDGVVEKAANDPVVTIARGEVLLLAGNRNASYCFDQVLKITPADDWKTPVWVALILKERRRWAKAIDYLARAAERKESEPRIWFQVGLCRAALGHRAQAEKAFSRAAELCEAQDPLLLKIQRSGKGTFWGWVRGVLKI
jgi:tetratricopeptide (TPR) repeat protein